MKIKLKRMILENYKCFHDKLKVIDFFQKTEISGKNRQGKSTIINAYMETMTGKETDGSMPDSIRPHDKDGKEIDKVDIIRQIDIDMDGKPVSIRKITKQKWTKPRGQTEERFDGNVTTYEVDGFATRQKEFVELMERIAKPDILLMCSNPQPFLTTMQKSTAEARKILEKLSGFDIDAFIGALGTEYAEIAEMLKCHSAEDVLKKLRKQLSDQKKQIEAQNTKISYEKGRESDVGQIEISDLELAKGEWKEKLEEIDKTEKMLDEAVKTYDALSGEIKSLKEKADSIKLLANSAIYTQRKDMRRALNDADSKKAALTNDLNKASANLQFEKDNMAFYQKEIDRARANYTEYSNRKFDETELHAIEAEQFDENSLICPTCGQSFPEDKQEELRMKFEAGKRERISKEQARKADFDNQTEGLLDNVVKAGNRANESLETAKKSVEDYEKKIAEIKENFDSEVKEIEQLTAELAALPLEEDLSGNAEYQEILNQITEKETTLSGLNNGSEQRAVIRAQRNECYAEIAKIGSQIQRQVAESDEKERRLAKLEADLRSMSQTAADIERQIDMVMNFSIKKNAELAKRINKYFRHFQFEFLEHTIDGNPVEVCKMVCNGTSYTNGLNGGDRKLCEIDLCRGFQNMQNLELPIFCDESNTIDSWRIPADMEQQLILIKRTDDDLTIKEI